MPCAPRRPKSHPTQERQNIENAESNATTNLSGKSAHALDFRRDLWMTSSSLASLSSASMWYPRYTALRHTRASRRGHVGLRNQGAPRRLRREPRSFGRHAASSPVLERKREASSACERQPWRQSTARRRRKPAAPSSPYKRQCPRGKMDGRVVAPTHEPYKTPPQAGTPCAKRAGQGSMRESEVTYGRTDRRADQHTEG